MREQAPPPCGLKSAGFSVDEGRGVRLKTVELVVEEKPWWPAASRQRDGELVAVKDAYDETALRAELRGLGGQWDATAKVWRIAYGLIRNRSLEKRIVQTPGS